MRAAVILLTAVAFIVLASVASRMIVVRLFSEDYVPFLSVKGGMSEQEVVARLGPPDKVYDRETAPEDYYVPGHAYKKRRIGHKVYIYRGTEAVLYVYFNRQMIVEDVYVGGS